jgi:hypothetical protein
MVSVALTIGMAAQQKCADAEHKYKVAVTVCNEAISKDPNCYEMAKRYHDEHQQAFIAAQQKLKAAEQRYIVLVAKYERILVAVRKTMDYEHTLHDPMEESMDIDTVELDAFLDEMEVELVESAMDYQWIGGPRMDFHFTNEMECEC